MQRIVHDVRQVMPDDGIVCLDNGMYKIWFARNYRTQVANTLLLDNALATMGAGLPAGITPTCGHHRGKSRRLIRAISRLTQCNKTPGDTVSLEPPPR
jgi:thiamine pyrophosphate-dependent acetolactate synthase large subunit-like protein